MVRVIYISTIFVCYILTIHDLLGQNQIASPKLNGDTINGDGDQLNLNNEPGNKSINGTYDSVSSYDSNNITSQLTMANLRLGPNAPDDLKSVPSIK